MTSTTIERIESGLLLGRRPRPAGSNARLGPHGDIVRMPTVRITTTDGAAGFGRSSASEERLRSLIGRPIEALVDGGMVAGEWRDVEFPLVDLAARIAGVPVHRLSGSTMDAPVARTYDTSLYFDDLHLDDDAAAAALIADEARQGWERGHRAFKIKVGRGARHMPLEEGTARDIAIIHAVRDAVGPDALVMIDANNGWNLNVAKQVLAETATDSIYWLEEAFHEDDVLYSDLREWLNREGIATKIADGEGAAHPALVTWARNGVIDVVQYDMVAYGFGTWRTLGQQLDAAGVATAPHTYGNGFGHLMTCHLTGVVERLEPVEWDEAIFDAIDASGWVVRAGLVAVPELPGFGLELDDALYTTAVRENGFTLSVT